MLWALLLLSGLAGAAAFVARSNALLTRNLGEFAQAESAADAAIINAISMLSDERTSRHLRLDGRPQMWEFQGVRVSVSVSREAGRIDLNTANDDLILALLHSQGIPDDRATAMLGDLRKYQHVAKGPAPAGTLRTIEELKKIPNWTTQDLDCWRNSLTVYTGLPTVSPSDATEQVDAALKWAKDRHVGSGDWSGTSSASRAASDQSLLGDVIRISASTSPKPGISTSIEWIGRLTGDSHQPTLTMRWSRKSSASDSTCGVK